MTSARGTVAGLASPHPLATGLPGLFQERELDMRTGELGANMAQRFTAAFDELLAPVFSSLDNFEAYLDPALTPPDFLDWLSGWVGVELDENWPLERRRAHVRSAVALYRRRGTSHGLAEVLALYTGADVEVIDCGGIAWSTEPETELPGAGESHVIVRLRIDDPDALDRARVEAIVAAAKPAHVVAEIEVQAR